MSGKTSINLNAQAMRARWKSGATLCNAWLTIPDPYLAEMVAASGQVDTVTLDLQHGLFDRRDTIECIRAIAAHGPAPLARLPGLDESLISFLLDAAAVGLILPSTSGPAEAEAFVTACRFPPRGRRSYGPTRAALATDDVTAVEPITLAMIETAPGLAACAGIAATDGLDGIFAGPGDLGIALGLGPGQDREEAEIRQAFVKIREAANQAGKIAGTHASSPEYAAKMAASGFRFVTVWVDSVAVRSTLSQSAATWQELMP